MESSPGASEGRWREPLTAQLTLPCLAYFAKGEGPPEDKNVAPKRELGFKPGEEGLAAFKARKVSLLPKNKQTKTTAFPLFCLHRAKHLEWIQLGWNVSWAGPLHGRESHPGVPASLVP